MSDFLKRINRKKTSTKSHTINLSKKGASHSINLKKNNNELSFNLNWSMKSTQLVNLDLDLGCMYRLKNGKQGVIQAIGNNFGSLKNLPFIALDKDDRSGTNIDGETLQFSRVEELEFAVVFAFIYEGAINWKEAQGVATIKQPNHPNIMINLNDNSSKTMVGIATLLNENNNLKVEKLEKYYSGHRALDEDFGFGFHWTAGSK
jgi:tellurite resistance protein TerA